MSTPATSSAEASRTVEQGVTTESLPAETKLEILEIKPEEPAITPQEFNYVVSAGSTKMVVYLKKPLSSQQDFTALVKQAQVKGNTTIADSLIQGESRKHAKIWM